MPNIRDHIRDYLSRCSSLDHKRRKGEIERGSKGMEKKKKGFLVLKDEETPLLKYPNSTAIYTSPFKKVIKEKTRFTSLVGQFHTLSTIS